MSNNVVVEDHEALIMYHHHHHHPYPCPAYFVQSPSATTLTQNDAESSTFHSPARGSVHCYHHHKKVSYDESHATAPTENDGDINRLIIMNRNRGDDDEEEDDVFDYDWRKEKGWRRYWTYRNTDSWAWIWIQISWRLLVSLSVALLVFYIATKPPPPVLSLEGREELYAESGTTIYEMEVGVKNKAMYGAGREMEDLLESERGLPIVVGVSVRSTYRMVPSLINPKFHHNLQCLILLHNHYDTKHRTQLFNTTCRLFTS
ncbi:uncharacterized protein LOC129299349 isoform X3 [Prosopis cineraria]|uniref:uncharacterized protein LOC129299349 isoform X3 n=1 Tax=Prosopis cineraria TaxID=364024 RepID=UPI002410B3E6|nr:uncharacterized protein LOC129299349 isoform X3 [Prosopis cineraria]